MIEKLLTKRIRWQALFIFCLTTFVVTFTNLTWWGTLSTWASVLGMLFALDNIVSCTIKSSLEEAVEEVVERLK